MRYTYLRRTEEHDLRSMYSRKLSEGIFLYKKQKRGILIEHGKEEKIYSKYSFLCTYYLHSAYCMQISGADPITVYYFLYNGKCVGNTGA